MLTLQAHMSLFAVGWLFTVGVLAHNLEEAILLPAWSATAPRRYVPAGPREFAFAVTVLSILFVVLAATALTAGAHSTWAYLFTGYVFAIVVNVFVPHLFGSLALTRYVPGTATAVFFNLPLGVLFLRQALAQGFVQWRTAVWAAPATALGILALIPVLFAVGRKLLPDAAPHESRI